MNPTSPRPRVYCASPAHRSKMWREDLVPAVYGGRINIVSTWHEMEEEDFATKDAIPDACARYWEQDFKELRQSDVLLAYAEHKDRPNGTLVEIGYALAQEIPVFLVGNYEWGTWRHHASVTLCATVREAIEQITKEHADGET